MGQPPKGSALVVRPPTVSASASRRRAASATNIAATAHPRLTSLQPGADPLTPVETKALLDDAKRCLSAMAVNVNAPGKPLVDKQRLQRGETAHYVAACLALMLGRYQKNGKYNFAKAAEALGRPAINPLRDVGDWERPLLELASLAWLRSGSRLFDALGLPLRPLMPAHPFRGIAPWPRRAIRSRAGPAALKDAGDLTSTDGRLSGRSASNARSVRFAPPGGVAHTRGGPRRRQTAGQAVPPVRPHVRLRLS